jgi:hypothetical protein
MLINKHLNSITFMSLVCLPMYCNDWQELVVLSLTKKLAESCDVVIQIFGIKALWIINFDQDEKPEILFFAQLWQYFLFSKKHGFSTANRIC